MYLLVFIAMFCLASSRFHPYQKSSTKKKIYIGDFYGKLSHEDTLGRLNNFTLERVATEYLHLRKNKNPQTKHVLCDKTLKTEVLARSLTVAPEDDVREAVGALFKREIEEGKLVKSIEQIVQAQIDYFDEKRFEVIYKALQEYSKGKYIGSVSTCVSKCDLAQQTLLKKYIRASASV